MEISVKFYCDNKPKVGEIVQIILTERLDDHAIGYMTEYNCNIIITYAQATKRRKIRSINKEIPLDKEIITIVEDFDPKSNIANVSKSYLDSHNKNYINMFYENYMLFNGIYQICKQKKINFDSFWKDVVYPFISTKYNIFIEDYEEEDDKILGYLDIFNKYLQEFETVVKDIDIFEAIKNKFNTFDNKLIIKKNIGIISNNGINKTKELLESCLSDSEFIDNREYISIKYNSTPNYTIETSLSEEILNNFVELIKKNSKKLEGVYVKEF